MTDNKKSKMPNYIEPLIVFAKGIKDDPKQMKCSPLLGDKIDNETEVDEIAFGLRAKFLALKKQEGIDIN